MMDVVSARHGKFIILTLVGIGLLFLTPVGGVVAFVLGGGSFLIGVMGILCALAEIFDTKEWAYLDRWGSIAVRAGIGLLLLIIAVILKVYYEIHPAS